MYEGLVKTFFVMLINLQKKTSSDIDKLFDIYDELINEQLILIYNFTIAEELPTQIDNQVGECVEGNDLTQADSIAQAGNIAQADNIAQASNGKYVYKCKAFVLFSFLFYVLDFNLKPVYFVNLSGGR